MYLNINGTFIYAEIINADNKLINKSNERTGKGNNSVDEACKGMFLPSTVQGLKALGLVAEETHFYARDTPSRFRHTGKTNS